MDLDTVIATRVPAETAKKLRRLARQDDRSLCAFCRRLIMAAVADLPDGEAR